MIKAIFIIVRPINVVISMMSVYLGGVISFDKYYSNDLLLACFSAGLVAGFGNVCNDIFDIEIDRKSKPFRPLPSSQITIKSAVVLAVILSLVGLVSAALINRSCLLIASVTAIALLLYTPLFKGKGYAGNILISLISAMAFFYGAAATGNISGGLIPAVFAYLFHFIREIVKDMEDYEADKVYDIQTGAVRYGFKVSRGYAVGLMMILIIATLIPYQMKIYGLIYLVMVILGTDIFLLYFIIRLYRRPDKQTYRLISAVMKAVMPLGILAVFVGSRGF